MPSMPRKNSRPMVLPARPRETWASFGLSSYTHTSSGGAVVGAAGSAGTVDAVVSLTGFSLVGGPAYNDSRAAEDILAKLDAPKKAAKGKK